MKRMLTMLVCVAAFAATVPANDMSREVEAAAAKLMPKVIEWRRHIHQNPELGNREFKTAKYVEDHLRRLGIEVRTGVAKTGVVGRRGRRERPKGTRAGSVMEFAPREEGRTRIGVRRRRGSNESDARGTSL